MNSICVVGLGYVGLPLAISLAKKHTVVGFDINEKRVAQLQQYNDATNEISDDVLKKSSFTCTTDASVIAEKDFVIVTVPTPIQQDTLPDLSFVKSACETVGTYMSPQTIVIFESTVYPGTTEEVCVPLLEKHSGLHCGKEFSVGYSPERINPQDKEHTVETIAKVVSGYDEKTLRRTSELYRSVIQATIHEAPNIKTAEAAKVIENIQRDVNIALVNELSMIFHKEGIRTQDVIDAAATKWNFHRYSPGLVGGHCIGVDPYYLAHRSLRLGHNPHMILSGRFVNEHMVAHVANIVEERIKASGDVMREKKVLVLGVTYKPNVNDLRNSKVKQLIRELDERGCVVSVEDPLIENDILLSFCDGHGVLADDGEKYDAVIFAVGHEAYLTKGSQWISQLLVENGTCVDLSGKLDGSVFEKEKLHFDQL